MAPCARRWTPGTASTPASCPTRPNTPALSTAPSAMGWAGPPAWGAWGRCGGPGRGVGAGLPACGAWGRCVEVEGGMLLEWAEIEVGAAETSGSPTEPSNPSPSPSNPSPSSPGISPRPGPEPTDRSAGMTTGHGIAAAEGQARKTGRRRSVAARARGDARRKNTVGEKRRRKKTKRRRRDRT